MSGNHLKINPTLLNCVIEGTVSGLAMTGITPEAVGISRFSTASREISVIVGLHGRRNGNLTLNLSKHTTMFLGSRLIGTETKQMDDDVVDAICEIGNMIAGKFHTLLNGTSWHFDSISLPALVFGANYNLYYLKNIVSVAVTFEIAEFPMANVEDKFFTSSIAVIGG